MSSKNNRKIRTELLFLIIPIAVIPLIILITFISFRIYNKLETQAFEYYDTLLTQVNSNINFVYEQYGRTMANMLETSAFKNYIKHPPFKTKQEEDDVSIAVIGDEVTDFGLRKNAQEKIDGFAYIYEMNRKSLITEKNYKMLFCNDSGSRPPDPYYEKIINDPLFLHIKNNNSIKLIMGKFQDGVIPSMDGDKKTVLIYPFYEEPPTSEEDTFDVFLLVVLHTDFVKNFYIKINQLKFGTLYILDQFNNLISYNHPAISLVDNYDDSDYYDFDTEKNRYILAKDDPKPEGELLFFEDYRMLNTDFNILNNERVVKLLDSNPDDDEYYYKVKKNFITHNNKRFITVFNRSDITGVKLIYFHPIKQVQKPIFEIINIMLAITLLVIVIIIVISFKFSKTFTHPIKALVNATKWVAEGNYNQFIDTKTKNEIGDLSDNFNSMIKNIKSYQDKLLSAERERSELELASKIQTCLLPGIPDKTNYDITAIMLPASEVGGDYYDIIGETNGRIWFGIGDVSGHGLTSGLIMMMAQTAFNTILLSNPNISSNELISEVNRVMFQNIKQRLGEDHFMTLSFIVVDPDGKVNFAGAHLDILVYRKATKKVERIETAGVWLGLIPEIKDKTYEKKFKLEIGDIFLLYTDGLIEATNVDGEQYDMTRLINKLEELGEKPVKEIEDKIVKDVFDFLNEQKDDITFVITKKTS